MRLETLHDLYQWQLGQLYKTDRETLSLLSTLQKSSSAPQLADVFARHIPKTRDHVDRLSRMVHQEDGDADARPNGARRLLQGCLELSKHAEASPDVLDAALIASAQHLVHDQIAGYGCARAWANVMGDVEAAGILQRCLADKYELDRDLSAVAAQVNVRAAHALAQST